MEKINFINLVSILTNKKIDLRLNVYGATKKWYDTTFSDFTELEVNQDYTVFIDETQQFTFKTGKNSDTFVKSFLTQYISKASIFNISTMEYMTKEEKRDSIVNNVNNTNNFNRLSKYIYYTTLYGIGMFIFFMNEKTIQKYTTFLNEYLKASNINYKNEYSEAGWVYRWVIKSDINHHNLILSNLK